MNNPCRKGAMVLARGDELASEHVLALLELPEGEGDRGGDSWLHAVASLQFHPARAEFETLFIRRALRAAGGNLSQAAQTMALARRTLQRKVQEYEIDVDGLRTGSQVRQLDAPEGEMAGIRGVREGRDEFVI